MRVGVKVAAETACSGTVARANGHGGPRARVSNVNAQLFGHDPNVRRVELHEFEQFLLIVIDVDGVGGGLGLAINGDRVDIFHLQLVVSQIDGQRNFVSIDLAGQNCESGLIVTISGQKDWAVGESSVVGEVVKGDDGRGATGAVSEHSQFEHVVKEWRESGEDGFDLERAGDRRQVHIVEVFVSVASVPVNIEAGIDLAS